MPSDPMLNDSDVFQLHSDLSNSFLTDASVLKQTRDPEDSIPPLPPPMPSLSQLCNRGPATSKKRKVCTSFLTDDSVLQETRDPEDSIPPLPPPMPSLSQLCNRGPATSKKWKVCTSFLTDDSVLQETRDPEDSIPPLPPPMPSLSQLCNRGPATSKKWKVCTSFLTDDSVLQETRDPEDSIPPLPPPMPSLSQLCNQCPVTSTKRKIYNPDESCTEGFAISTPVLDGGYFPEFFPPMVDPPSPIFASSLEKPHRSSSQPTKSSDQQQQLTNPYNSTQKQHKNDLTKQMIFKKRQSEVNFSLPSEEPIVVEDYTPRYHKVDKQWIPELGLKQTDQKVLLHRNSWLTDNIIDAAQKLLKKVNPAVPGLQDVGCGLTMNFAVQPGEFVQILHTGQGHWNTVSTIGTSHPEVQIFDSMFITLPIMGKAQIAALLAANERMVTVKFMDV